MKTTRRLDLLLLIVIAVAVAACSIPSDSEPRTIDTDALPPGLAQGTAPPTTPPPPSGDDEMVYVVRTSGEQQRLHAQAIPDPGDLEGRVQALLSPELVLDTGLSTLIPDGVELEGIEVDDGLATISLSEEFGEAEGDTQRFAVAQLVFTTQVGPIDRVRFRIGGEIKPVPAQGELFAEVVDRGDYNDIEPPES